MKLYISHLCPDCPPAMEHLNSRQVQYELLDIQKDISVLKEFLKIRDTQKEFEPIREDGYIGIPCLVEGYKYLFYDEIMAL